MNMRGGGAGAARRIIHRTLPESGKLSASFLKLLFVRSLVYFKLASRFWSDLLPQNKLGSERRRNCKRAAARAPAEHSISYLAPTFMSGLFVNTSLTHRMGPARCEKAKMI